MCTGYRGIAKNFYLIEASKQNFTLSVVSWGNQATYRRNMLQFEYVAEMVLSSLSTKYVCINL